MQFRVDQKFRTAATVVADVPALPLVEPGAWVEVVDLGEKEASSRENGDDGNDDARVLDLLRERLPLDDDAHDQKDRDRDGPCLESRAPHVHTLASESLASK